MGELPGIDGQPIAAAGEVKGIGFCDTKRKKHAAKRLVLGYATGTETFIISIEDEVSACPSNSPVEISLTKGQADELAALLVKQ